MSHFKAYSLLLLTAVIWGLAFVAQSLGSRYLDPFVFNGLRFALGALFVWVVALSRGISISIGKDGFILGSVLFLASFFQQLGISRTSAGAAGFITGLYVVFVPIIGIYRKQRISLSIYLALSLSIAGMFLMNDFSSVDVSLGNLMVLAGAVFWAVHVQLIDKYRAYHSTLSLAINQYSVASCLGLAIALLWLLAGGGPEDILQNIGKAWIPLFYGGVFSVGIAFSLQAFAQKRIKPAPAALILCSEGIFAMISGYLILGEQITLRIALGAGVMILAMILVLTEPLRTKGA